MWPNDGRTAVSFTFDDGDASQITIAARELEARGHKGTFFITPKIYDVEARAGEWKSMHERGHEIGNHTYTHPCELLSQWSAEELSSRETGPCEQWLNDHIAFDDLRNYAYICGITELATPGEYRKVVEATFFASRAGGGGPASVALAKNDKHLIPAQAVTYDQDDPAIAINYIKQAETMPGVWAVLVFHRFAETGPAERAVTSTATLRAIMDYVADPERFWVATFRDVLNSALSSPA